MTKRPWPVLARVPGYFLEYPGSGLGLGMSIMPLIIIVYLDGRDVKAAFGLEAPPAA